MATYDVMRYRASHNSYSGGDRGSVVDQLDARIRCRIGHLKPGAEVQLGAPNPIDHQLGSWLGVVAAWSKANPGHEPVTIVLDAKDDPTDNTDADLEELNCRLEAVFGADLFTRVDFDRHGSWPEVEDMRGKVLCVLSGNGGSRAAYRWAFGTAPALGANTKGDVVLAYRSSTAEINGWVGKANEGADAVAGIRKHTLASSDVDLADPCIQVNDDGWVGGLVCRAWGFAELDRPTPATVLENFPATDTPLIAWYQTYVE